jgi:hypothetical protein
MHLPAARSPYAGYRFGRDHQPCCVAVSSLSTCPAHSGGTAGGKAAAPARRRLFAQAARVAVTAVTTDEIRDVPGCGCDSKTSTALGALSQGNPQETAVCDRRDGSDSGSSFLREHDDNEVVLRPFSPGAPGRAHAVLVLYAHIPLIEIAQAQSVRFACHVSSSPPSPFGSSLSEGCPRRGR